MRGLRLGILLAAAAVLISASAAEASATRASVYAITKVQQAPPTDAGAIAAGPWASGLHIQDFTNVDTRVPASLPTTAVVLYSDKAIYVAFRCEQRSVPISDSRNITDVQSGNADYVELDIDPSGTGARSYAFDATPGGLRYQYSSENARYAPRWSASAYRDANGYLVYMTIPLDVLRGEAGSKRAWRMNLMRHVAALNDSYTWAYDVAASSTADPTSWPAISGITIERPAARPAPQAAVYALTSSGVDREEFQTEAGSFTRQRPRFAGADVTVPLTTTTSFVATLNPDFSNVELDQVVIAPQQFRQQLREYRPFFAQGASFVNPLPAISFTAGAEQAFYSPSIGVFNRGLKLEGTQGRNSFGVLDVQGAGFDDRAFGFQNARPDASQTFSAEGVMADHEGIRDDTFGLGYQRRNVRSGETTIATFMNESGSQITVPGAATFFDILEGIQTQSTLALVGYRHAGAQFAPLDGYTPIDDVSGPEGTFSYFGTGRPSSAVRTWSISTAADRYRGGDGNVHLGDLLLSGSVTTKSLFSFSGTVLNSQQEIGLAPYPMYLDEQYYRFTQTMIGVGYRSGTPSPVNASYGFGPFAVPCAGLDSPSSVCSRSGNAFLVQAYVRQADLTATTHVGRFYTVTGEYNGVQESSLTGLPADGQWLRRISISRGIGSDSSVSLQLRSISGNGGFSLPGVNLSAGVHLHTRHGDDLYVNFGSPGAYSTLDRYVLKYVWNVGRGTGP